MLRAVERTIPSVCVFCGGSPLVGPAYLDLARAVGAALAARGVRLVYGGAHTGLMGALADAALGAGGAVVGVMPSSLRNRELAHGGLTELHIVDSMAVRKERMFAESDAFLALPGGFGTLDEVFEAVTLRQIGEHAKPIALLDTDGFWSPLYDWVERAVDRRFVPDNVRDALHRLDSLDALDRWLAALRP